MTDAVAPRVRIVSHPGETDDSRLDSVERDITDLKQQVHAVLDLLQRMTRTAETTRHAIEDRVREIELAHP